MNSQTRREIRLGLIALPLSGLLLTLGAAVRGPVNLPELASYIIQAARSPNYVPAWTIILVGVVLNLFGTFGLYRYLSYQGDNLIAFLAFVLRTAGIALFAPLFTFLAVSGPVIADLYQQGNHEVIALVEANFSSGLGLALLGVAAGAATMGLLLFATAIWRDGRLPKWTAVLLVLAFLLQLPPDIVAIELLGLVFLTISTGMIAWIGWQESVTGTGQ